MRRTCVAFLLALALCLSLAPAAAAEGEPWIEASGAIVLDYDTGEVYFEKDADTARPAASMTKVMSVYLVFEEIAAGRLALDSLVAASPRAAALSNNPTYSGMEMFKAGESYPVDTLLRLILTSSGNASVLLLAEHIGGSEEAFVERMNAKAAEMGIDARFADSCGIADAGNAVTPRAMALLAKRIIEDFPQILEYTSLKRTYFDNRIFESSNYLLRNDLFEGVDGLKTGTTTAAGFCFTATAKRDGRRIIAVLMNNKTSREAVMSEGKTLLEYGFARRAERESTWGAEEKKVQITVSAPADSFYPYALNRLTATVSGLSDGVRLPCAVQWTVNGAAVEAKGIGVAANGEAAGSLACTAPGGTEQLDIRCAVTMPNGTTAEGRLVLPAAQGEITFTGELGAQRIELRPEDSVTVPCQIACDQGLDLTVAAGWYMDGEPIPNFQNEAFRLTPRRASEYTVRWGALAPGEHVLELRCNTAGLPGVEQEALRCEILVLAPEQAA